MIDSNGPARRMYRATLKDLKQTVCERPSDASAVRALGIALRKRRELNAALEYLLKATELDPVDPKNHCQFAETLWMTGQLEKAAEAFQAALELTPHDANIYLRLGRIYKDLGRPAEALPAFIRGIELAPDHSAQCYANLCRICIDGKSVEEGESIASTLTRHVNRQNELMKGVAIALEAHGRYPEARAHWGKALKQFPDDILTLTGAANVELALRNIEAAGSLYNVALALQPTNSSLIWEVARFHFRTGRYDRAFELLHGALPKPSIQTQFVAPSPAGTELKWEDGVRDFSGKTVLVKGEGSYGDFLQDCRFVSLIKERGAHVIFECLPNLKRLCATLPGADEVVAQFEECSPFDFQCSSSYIATAMEWTWEWATKTSPYLFASSDRVSAWGERLGRSGLKIGVNWRSNDNNEKDAYCFRSMPLTEFRPLSALPGARIFSLQVGSGTEELTASAGSWVADSLGNETIDFSDAAAAVMALDAVVTVDTSMAHLAGALCKPCFVMLPYYPTFRWMSESDVFARNRFLWYPSVRVFRQKRPGEWSSVIEEVAQAVNALAHEIGPERAMA